MSEWQNADTIITFLSHIGNVCEIRLLMFQDERKASQMRDRGAICEAERWSFDHREMPAKAEVAPIFLPVLSPRPSVPSSNNLSSDFVSLHLVPIERGDLRLRRYVTYRPCCLYPVGIPNGISKCLEDLLAWIDRVY